MNPVLWLSNVAAVVGIGVFTFFIRRANRPGIGGELAKDNAMAAIALGLCCEAVAAILLVVGLVLKWM